MSFTQQIAAQVLPVLVTAITAILTAVIAALSKRLMDHFKSASAKEIIARVDVAVEAAVRDVSNVEVKALVDANGNLSPENRKKVKDVAVDKVKSLLGSITLDKLRDVANIPRGDAGDAKVIDFIATYVEKGVWFMKLQQVAAQNAPPAAPAAALPVPK